MLKRNYVFRAAGLAAVSGVLVLATANPSSAATNRTASCSTTGAKGYSTTAWTGDPYQEQSVTLGVTDTSADGHHVRVRYLTQQQSGATRYWQWHSNTDGNGTSKTWYTSAKSDYGIWGFGVEIARFEGDTLLNSCVDWG
ncbi:hypothetical protein RM863_38635 [Streptomyces sp. DSM 41014]|uniref:Secreted protein n=1 Tax=Streptomyces hintoniae TaxID=3075521 RepID=A0ABU2UY15_9ACTN|nr:hypothetical protein [Streptomyces sp. DSM 41014]MDT0478049.1 hypothetical protein [Streptomyces sp. DSM 41014]